VHRFIVYQYGKVGSTSVTAALNRLPGVEAHQCHFLGVDAFAGTVKRLTNPELSDYFFEHGAGQLIENLRIFRYFQRREIDPGPVTMLTMAREPFDWFRSAMSQDIAEHLVSLRRMLQVRGLPCGEDSEVVGTGIAFLLERLLCAVQHFGSLDAMCEGARYPELRRNMEHADAEDFRAFMFFVNIFTRPHLWFQTHFLPVTGVELAQLSPVAEGVDGLSESWGGIYLIRYESLQTGFQAVLDDVGIDRKARLPRKNRGDSKRFAAELEAAFSSEVAMSLGAACHSRDTRALGYVPRVTGAPPVS